VRGCGLLEEDHFAHGRVDDPDQSHFLFKDDEEAQLRVQHRRHERHWALPHAVARSASSRVRVLRGGPQRGRAVRNAPRKVVLQALVYKREAAREERRVEFLRSIRAIVNILFC